MCAADKHLLEMFSLAEVIAAEEGHTFYWRNGIIYFMTHKHFRRDNFPSV